MKLHRRQFLHLAAGVWALPAASRLARAQAYPTRPITIIVPYPAGGSTGALARIMLEPLQKTLGQPIIIENVGGAGGSIGVGRVARAAPDGYSVCLSHIQTHVLNGAVLKLSYDVVKDFESVALVADTPQAIIVRKTLPANNLKEMIAWLKASPDKGTAGAVGVGGPSDIAAHQFQMHTGTRFQVVPYRGGGPILTDLIGGQIDINFGQVSSFIGAIRSNQIKAIAIMSKERWWGAPEISTVDKSGVSGLHGSFWHGMWVPKGTPPDVIAKLNSAVVAALADPTVQQRFREAGQSIWPRAQQTPEALAAHQKAEIEKWWPVIRAAGIKAE